MPYRRSYRRRGYRRRYPRRGSGAVDWMRMAKSAYTGVRYLKSLVNVEKHALDTNYSITPDSVTGNFNCLNLIAQGDTSDARQGNSVKLHGININIKAALNGGATNTTIRFILFYDLQSNGSTPVGADILSNVTTVGNYNHDNAQRFPILADRRMTICSSGASEKAIRIYRRLNMHEYFDGTTAAIGDVVSNALWLFVISDETTNTPNVLVRSQLMFIDN